MTVYLVYVNLCCISNDITRYSVLLDAKVRHSYTMYVRHEQTDVKDFLESVPFPQTPLVHLLSSYLRVSRIFEIYLTTFFTHGV